MNGINKKKKVAFLVDHALAKTGFGRYAKSIISYLYQTGKYDIVQFCAGTIANNPDLDRVPWKCYGVIIPEQINQLKQQNPPQSHGDIERTAAYGRFTIDELVKKEKVEVLWMVNDVWGVDFIAEHPWYNKITSVPYVTLDSRPILPTAIALAKKSKHFWNWNEFSTEEMHKMGLSHVKTVYGTIDCSPFYPLPSAEKAELRKKFNIPQNEVIFSCVSRNQLRKGYPNLIEAMSLFKKDNPQIKNVKFLFHTSFNEGWNIPSFCAQFGVPIQDILTTYICRDCGQYEIKHYQGDNLKCRFCNSPQSQTTTGPAFGVTEKQLNEIYNISNFYLAPITSGGLEIGFAIESKLCGLPGAVTNYSCGEDFCKRPVESATFPLDYSEYLEGAGTNFIKSWTFPYSIAKVMKKFYLMDSKEYKKLSNNAREFALKTFSVDSIGKIYEEFIDAAPFINDPSVFENKKLNADPNHQIPQIADDGEWILYLYAKILDRPVDRKDEGFLHWANRIHKDLERPQIEQYFRQVAFKTLQEQKGGSKLEDFLNPADKGRVLVVIPENADDVYLATATFESIKNRYPDWALYVATKPPFRSIIEGNPYINGILEYNPIFENPLFGEGQGQHRGTFEIVYLPLKNQSYSHNAKDAIDFKSCLTHE